MRKHTTISALLALLLIAGGSRVAGQRQQQDEGKKDDSFRFKSGVELINVTATVTDRNERFVPGLHQEDFTIYEDNVKQEISHFSNERVPVSLGIVLDTSGSMAGEKLDNALSAIDRFLGSLLDPTDEIFVYRFSNFPELIQDWTTDRKRLSRVIGRITAGGGTAMYDALAEAVPMAQTGQNRKKAIVLISDGNDTDSDTSLSSVKQLIRETEVMVYAIGIDGRSEGTTFGVPGAPGGRPPFPIPMRCLMAGTAAAASGRLTVIRTSSEPACANSMHCCAVDPTSGVSVLVIDCTAIGAPPPICTGPTLTPTVL